MTNIKCLRVKIFVLVMLVPISGIFSSPALAVTFVKDNGVIRVHLNEFNYPMITSLFIGGQLVMPHDNSGADFQMTARSFAGNAYNPTQGGDCVGNPSILTGVLPNWTGIGGISPNFGILLGIDPRNYNAGPPGPCRGVGPVLPFNFNFGVTLGDGVVLPKQAMVVDMAMQREPGSQEVVRFASDLPAAFPLTAIMRWAYASQDGLNFYPLQQFVPGIGYTHDTLLWTTDENSLSVNRFENGRVIALLNVPNAHLDNNAGFGMAFYSHTWTGMAVSHRFTGSHHLTLIDMVGEPHGTQTQITDFNWRVLRRLMVVGNIATMRAAIQISESRITDWGNWFN